MKSSWSMLAGLVLALTPMAALAGTVVTPVPEPTTMGIAAIAAAGTAVAYRLLRRK